MNENKLKKEFALSSWAIDNKMVVFVITAIILIGGTMAYFQMPREAFPEIIENKIYISNVYPGNSVEDVEKFVTKPLEDEIKNLSGVVKIESTSLQDYSMILVEIDEKYSIEQAKNLVKDKVDIAKGKSDWPTLDGGSKVDPYVFDLNIAEEFPIANINLKGDYTPQELKEFGEKLQDAIEELQEIKEVSIVGVNDKEVEVAVDLMKMSAAQVSITDIVNTIKNENVTISGGMLEENGNRTNMRLIGKVNYPKELENLVVKTIGGTVFLRDVAEIRFKTKETTTFARESGQEVVMLNVKKRSGTNMIDAMDKVKQIVEEYQQDVFPSKLNVSITGDQSTITENQVSDLVNNIIFGVLLVVGVLMFFLGLKNALFVGAAIPLSMLMSLMILHAFGITLNTMVLFALVMGLGMLVDNGIVVVENIFSLLDKGMSRTEAAKQGIGEIAWPIIASTATTLAAFFPLALWPGTMGKFMFYFPMTLSVVLGSSLFVALIINAMMSSEFMDKTEKNISKKGLKKLTIILGSVGILALAVGLIFSLKNIVAIGNLSLAILIIAYLHKYYFYKLSQKFQNNWMPITENYYKNFLERMLKNKRPVYILIGIIALFFISAFINFGIYQPEVNFFPKSQTKQGYVYIEYPEGTAISKTNEITKKIETKVLQTLSEYTYKKDGKDYNYMIESVVSQVGEGASNPLIDAGSQAEIPHKGKITITFREMKDRVDENGNKINSNEVLEHIRENIQDIKGPNIIVEKQNEGPPRGYPISIQLSGDDYSKLIQETQKLMEFINNLQIAGIEKLNANANKDLTEMIINLDRELAGSMNLSAGQVGQTLRASLFGLETSTYKDQQDDYKINVRGREEDRHSKEILLNQPITYKNPANGKILQVPIASVAHLSYENTFNQIKRKDYRRVITIYSNVLEGYNGTEITNKLKEKLKNYTFPKGISYKFSGEQEEQAKNQGFLTTALLLAVGGIILIIVLQFNSISKPFIIMFATLMSFIGVFLGMVIMQMDFVVIMTMMGIISLAGVIVNNAIVLIDYTQMLIDNKKEELNMSKKDWLPYAEVHDLIIESGRSRLRPVLLTAITTVLGLIPLSIGFNLDFFGLFQSFSPNIYFGGENVFFWGPLAKTVINGLIFATFLTLIIVPIMFVLIYKLKERYFLRNQ